MYPMEWKGENSRECGTAIFMVEGEKFEIALTSFTAAQVVSGMLETAFDSGKSFAAQQVVASIDYKMQEVRRKFGI